MNGLGGPKLKSLNTTLLSHMPDTYIYKHVETLKNERFLLNTLYIYIYIYIYIHFYIFTYIYIYTQIYTQKNKQLYICIYTKIQITGNIQIHYFNQYFWIIQCSSQR